MRFMDGILANSTTNDCLLRALAIAIAIAIAISISIAKRSKALSYYK